MKNLSLCLALLLLLLTGCGRNVPDEVHLRRNAKAITQAAGDLLQEGADLSISAAPQVIADLNPERINKTPQGLFIRTWESFVEEGGIFIPRDASAKFDEHGDPSFRKVADGLFYYEIKG